MQLFSRWHPDRFHQMRMWLFGVLSSFPLLTCVSVIPTWLMDMSIAKGQLALLAWSTLPYSTKLFLGPVIQMTSFGGLGRRWGHYSVWICLLCALLAGTLIVISTLDPTRSGSLLSVILLAVGLLGACLDCVLEGYRIHATPVEKQNHVAGYNATGYRLGGWLYISGSLLMASMYGWVWTLRGAAIVIGLVGVVASIGLPQPRRWMENFCWIQYGQLLRQGWSFFQRTFYFPWIIGLIAAQKLTDNLIRSMWHPYLVSIGIDKSDIVRIDKGYGLVMTMVGIQCGVWLIDRYRVRFALRLWVTLQALMMGVLAGMSMLIAHSSFNALFVTATLAYHLIGGLGHMSMLSYLSNLSKGGSANDDVHHAMLTSFGALGRTVVSWAAASLASHMDWPRYFACALVLCLPAFVLTGTVWPFARRDAPRE